MISITWARNAAQLATQRAQTCRPERHRAGRQRVPMLGGDGGAAVSPETLLWPPTSLWGAPASKSLHTPPAKTSFGTAPCQL